MEKAVLRTFSSFWFSAFFSSYRKKSHKFKPVQMGACLSCLMTLSSTEEHTSSSDGLIAFCKWVHFVSSFTETLSSISR